MFLPRTRPLAVREEQLRGLRLSLNTPELAAGELPSGPARAAIAMHEEPGGGLGLGIVVQSLGSGALVYWAWDERIDAAGETRVTEAALSFAESMGFLFDEDAFGPMPPGARRRALDQWWEIVGWSAADLPPADAASPESQIVASAPLEEPPAAAAPSRDRLPLTKFRRRLGAVPSEAPAPPPRASTLGRLRLVRRPARGPGGERPPFWLRLLGSF